MSDVIRSAWYKGFLITVRDLEPPFEFEIASPNVPGWHYDGGPTTIPFQDAANWIDDVCQAVVMPLTCVRHLCVDDREFQATELGGIGPSVNADMKQKGN